MELKISILTGIFVHSQWRIFCHNKKKATYNVETIRTAWNFAPDLSIEDLQHNKFLFRFTLLQDKEFILQSAPWNFKGHLMVLKECHWDYSIDEVDLSTTQFWVQLHGIPLSIASMLNISLIGRHMKSLLEIEPIPFGVACTKFERIWVEFDVSHPPKVWFVLQQKSRLNMKNCKTVWFLLPLWTDWSFPSFL